MVKSPCVLIVDDSIDTVQTLSDILGVAGYAVRTAPSAERALQILEGVSVDLVITDLRMGGMGGVALIRRLRESRPGLPVIALSGFADTTTVIQVFREGAADFITKPFTASEVLEAVARVLDRQRVTRSLSATPVSTSALSHAWTPEQRIQVEEILRALQGRLGAELTLLVGPGGELLAAHGWVSGSVAQAVAQVIGQVGTLLETLASVLGEPAFVAHAGEGEQRAFYGLRLDPERFLAAVVPRTVKPGLAWLELREALSRLRMLDTSPSVVSSLPEGSSPDAMDFLKWEEQSPGPSEASEGELLSYEEARARGLIPDLEEGVAGAG